MLFALIHLHGNSMCPFTSCAKRLHTEPSISILVSPSHISNCVTPALLLNGCRYANSETFASICLSFVLYDSIWWGNSEWIGIHILCETICFPPRCIGGVGGGNGQIHPFFHKCFHFKTSWGSRRRVLCSSILRQAACCYLINTGAWIHQWITSRVSRPSAASAQHIFWRAVPL